MFDKFSTNLANPLQRFSALDLLLKAFVISMFLPARFSNVIAIALLVYWLIEGGLGSKMRRYLKNPPAWIFSLFFLTFVLCLIYTTNMRQGLKEIETRAPLLFLSIVMGSTVSLSAKMVDDLITLFKNLCVIVCLIMMGLGAFKYLTTDDASVLFYRALANDVGFHPVYLSYFVVLGLVIHFTRNVRYGVLFWIYAFVLILAVVLLSSKLMTGVTILFLLVFLIRGNFHWRKAFVVLGIAACAGGAFFFDFNYDRIRDLFHDVDVVSKDNFGYDEPFNGFSLRLVFAKTALEGVSKDIPTLVFGVGAGDAQDFLNALYDERGLIKAGYRDYNTHNQFIDTVVETGLIGVAILVFLFVLNFRSAIVSGDKVFLFFMVMILVGCMTESVLERNKGVILVAFICSIYGARINTVRDEQN